jgi:hypothetical protein
VTELHRAVRRYAHDGKLIDLLGGLRSAIAQLDALIARYAPDDLDSAPGALEPVAGSLAPCALPPSARSPEWTDALLGVIAIRNHLSQALLAGAVAALGHDLVASRDEPDAEPSRSGPNQESLLR